MQFLKITNENLKYFASLTTKVYTSLLQKDEDILAAGALIDEIACGIIVFTWQGGVTDILYLAVANEYRYRGVGTGLVRFVQQSRIINRGIMRFDYSESKEDGVWSCFFDSMDDFEIQEMPGGYYKATYEDLKKSNILSKKVQECFAPKRFDQLPSSTQNKFFVNIENTGYGLKNHYLLDQKTYVKELTICSSDNLTVNAAIFIQKLNENDLILRYAYCTKAAKQDLIQLFIAAKEYIEKQYDANTNLFIMTRSIDWDNLLKAILPNITLLKQRYVAISIFPDE